MAGEILVPERPLRQRHAGRRVFVTGQIRGDIVDARLLVLLERVKDEAGEADLVAARLGNHGKVRWQRAIETGASRLLVRIGGRNGIGKPRRPLEHLAAVVGAVSDAILARDGPCLRLGEAGPARLRQRAERHELHAVAGAAHLAIDLEAALQLAAIELAEGSRKRPRLARRQRLALLGSKHSVRTGEHRGNREQGKNAHQPLPSGAATPPAVTGAPPFFFSTASEIELGSGRGVSMKPNSGRTTKKCAK